MAGCTTRQLLWKVRLPSAKRELLLGVNQVTMQTLAMVVIASMVGAKGLGHKLLIKLNTLKLGESMEIGVAIVILAVSLDRLTQAMAYYTKSSLVEKQTIFDKYNFGIILFFATAVTAFDWLVYSRFNYYFRRLHYYNCPILGQHNCLHINGMV